MRIVRLVLSIACVGILCGCGANYRWRPNVPSSARTVAVPTFLNESDVSEIGAVAARQLLREFQREGTFAIRSVGDAALEIQGTIKSATSGASLYDRRSGLRLSASDFVVNAVVTVIDKRLGKILIDRRTYQAQTTFTSGQDWATGRRDASGRAAEDLARQVVDDVLNLKWEK